MPTSRHVTLKGVAVVANRTSVAFYFVMKSVDMLIETSDPFKDFVAHRTRKFRIALMSGQMLAQYLRSFKVFATQMT